MTAHKFGLSLNPGLPSYALRLMCTYVLKGTLKLLTPTHLLILKMNTHDYDLLLSLLDLVAFV